jgi:hypothetical protein
MAPRYLAQLAFPSRGARRVPAIPAEPPTRAKRAVAGGQAAGVRSLSQESLPQRRERGGSFGAALRGAVAAAECVEQVCAVGGHQ